MASRTLEVVLTGDSKSLERALGRSSKESKSFGSSLGSLAKGGVFAAGALGVAGLAGTLKIGIDEFSESTKVAAQTEAVLKSTGGAANVTAKQVDDLANSILKKTGIDDEATKSGENLLLTFTNIRNEAGKGNDIFTQTTQIMGDMSVALGQDTKSSAIQLGKALNDPIKGISALRRVGVSFTDAQKDQIKALVASGHQMQAQKLILAELNKEFGGSAEAAGKTLPGQINILKQEFANFAGDLVARMMPTLLRLTKWMDEELPVAAAKVGEITAALSGFWEAHGATITKVLGDLVTIVQNAFDVVASIYNTFDDLIHGRWSQLWTDIKSIFTTEFELIKSYIQYQIDLVKAIFGGLATKVENVAHDIVDFFKKLPGRIAATLADLAATALNPVKDAFGKVSDKASAVVDGVVGFFKGAPGRIVDAVTAGLEAVKSLGTKLGTTFKNGIVDGVTGIAKLLEGIVKAALNTVISAWNAFHIPSVHIGFDTHIPGVGSVGFDTPDINFPDIPLLDTGGLVMKTGLAVVHQGETFSGVGPNARGGGGVVVNVHVAGSVTTERKLVEVIREGIKRAGQANGSDGLLATRLT